MIGWGVSGTVEEKTIEQLTTPASVPSVLELVQRACVLFDETKAVTTAEATVAHFKTVQDPQLQEYLL